MGQMIAVGTAERPKQHETVCGDVASYVPIVDGMVLCLADGLGHGAAARAAAERVTEHVRAHAETPFEALMRELDRALRGMRGAAVSLVHLAPAQRRLRYVGIGNVELRALAHVPIAPPTMPGIVGEGLRTVRVWDYPLAAGDLVVLFSDGISSRFDLGAFAGLAPQALADALVAAQHKAHDDASCVVARVQAA